MEKKLKEKLDNGQFSDVDPVVMKTMKSIKGKGNRTTELRLRLAMVRSALRGWKIHPKKITGNPDFYFPDKKLAVFVDGCFWHGCPECGHIPKTRSPFGRPKLKETKKGIMKKPLSYKSRV